MIISGTSAANSLSFNGASGTLEINTAGDLTLATALDIGTGTVFLDGQSATLHDVASMTISSGTIIGAGLVESVLTASGAAHITATGGTLNIAHQLTDSGNQLTLTITGDSTRCCSVLSARRRAVVFTNALGTLELDTLGQLTVGSAMAIGGGTVKLDSGVSSLTDASGITLNGGSIIGLGTITGNLSGAGTVAASGGTLELVTAIGASSGTTFQIANAASNILQVDSTVGTGNTFAFLGAAGELGLSNDAGFNSTIVGLNVGVGLTKTNFVDIEGHIVTITDATGGGTNSGTVTLSDGAVLVLSNISSTNWFADTVGDGAGGTDVFLSDTPCYCRGTLILTDRGEIAVEQLTIGDRVATLSGEAKAIKWIGRRSYDGRFVTGNRTILPICIVAGALADGIPSRDLRVSPEHALHLDGLLLPARLLVTGTTIAQCDTIDQLEYFHIELDRHDVIYADGAAAETYVDCDNRGMFQNGVEFAARYPHDVPAPWQFCAPRVEPGAPELGPVRAKLLARAVRLGRVSHDPDLHLIVDGRSVRSQSTDGRTYRFDVPVGADSVTIASSSVVPGETEAASDDLRRLGVPLERVELSGGGLCIEIRPDCPELSEGFHADEGSHRWTDGRGVLPPGALARFATGLSIEVQIAACRLHYPPAEPMAEVPPSRAVGPSGSRPSAAA